MQNTQNEIIINSTLDDYCQPALFYKAKGNNRPLLVGLHTWSFNRFNQIENMKPLAEKYDFNLLLPDFRGPNSPQNPQCKKACGSKYVIQDVKDAIDYCIKEYSVDKNNIFLLGASGGGQVALLVASHFPKMFTAVGAFVPVCNIVQWINYGYATSIIACCGDNKREMLRRSPINYIDGIAQSNTKIFHGKHDSFVPRQQSISLYNKIIKRYPDATVYLDIFDGAHEMDMELAEHWIISQYQKKINKNINAKVSG